MEEFFKHYQYTFAAFSSIGTLCAVIISLLFGYRAANSNRPKIRASIDYLNNSSTGEKELVVQITNVGIFPFQISEGFLCFKLPFEKAGYWLPTLNVSSSYPITINPNHSSTFHAPFDFTELRKAPRWKQSLISGVIQVNCESIKIKLGNGFKNELKEGDQ